MPEANYLLSVSWGYIKVGPSDSVLSFVEFETFISVCLL